MSLVCDLVPAGCPVRVLVPVSWFTEFVFTWIIVQLHVTDIIADHLVPVSPVAHHPGLFSLHLNKQFTCNFASVHFCDYDTDGMELNSLTD